MAKQVAIEAKQIGAAYQKFKPFRPLCNQRDEQCSNKNAEHRDAARAKVRYLNIARSDALGRKSSPNLAGELPKA